MANFTAFLAARTAKAPKSIKEFGISNSSQKMTIYCSQSTHTWIEKAVILFGLGTKSIRWIETTPANKIDEKILEETIKEETLRAKKDKMKENEQKFKDPHPTVVSAQADQGRREGQEEYSLLALNWHFS